MVDGLTLSTSEQVGASVYDWQLRAVPPTIKQVLVRCAREAGLTVDDIRGREPSALISDARQRFFYLAAKNPKWSYPRIARMAGRIDHTTAIYGARTYAKRHSLPMPEARL